MKFQFSPTSLEHLQNVHPDFVRLLNAALATRKMDFIVVRGACTLAQERALYAQGRTAPGHIVTWCHPEKSKHLIQADGFGHAVDLAPVPVDWKNMAAFHALADLIKATAAGMNLTVQYGGDWLPPATDSDHFQFIPAS